MKIKSKQEVDWLLLQLREGLADVLATNKKFDNDFFLYRWLILNNLKVDRTEKIIRQSIEWRKSYNVEELADNDLAYFAPGLENEVVIKFSGGFTKAGQPVTTSNGEGLDVKGVMRRYGKESCIRYFVQFAAKLENLMIEHHKKGHGSNSINGYSPSWDTDVAIHIVSYKDISIMAATSIEGIQMYVEAARLSMSNFPLAVSGIYIVNLNPVSNVIINLLKPWISGETHILECFGTNKDKWSKFLLEIIDADQLERYFGGSKTDGKTIGSRNDD